MNQSKHLDALRGRAERGDPEAQLAFGKSLVESIDYNTYNYTAEEIREREAASEEWLRKAAEQGLAQAQFEIGDLIPWRDSIDWPEETEEARKWYRAAAVQDHAEACMALAALEFDRNPVALDEAVRWYRRGRELGQAHDASGLCLLSPYEDYKPLYVDSQAWWLERKLTPALAGKIDAQYFVARLFAFGDADVAPDFQKAYAWFRVASREFSENNLASLPSTRGLGWQAPIRFAEIRAARAALILGCVLDDEALSRAQALAKEYRERHGPPIGWFQRKRINYGSWWKALLFPLLGREPLA